MRVAVIIAVLIVLGLSVAVVPAFGEEGALPASKMSKSGLKDVIIYRQPGLKAGKAAAVASIQDIEPRVQVLSEYKAIDGVHARLPGSAIENLRKQGYHVEEDRLIPFALDSSNPVIFSDRSKRSNYRGSGIKVCVLDSGIDFYHTQVPVPQFNRTADWLNRINGPYQPSTNGTTYNYTIYVNESLPTLNFSINWWVDADNRFDISVTYPNGSYAGGTNGTSAAYNPVGNGWWWLYLNMTDVPGGFYNITINNTAIVDSSGEYWTMFWDPYYPAAGITISDFGGHGTHVIGTIAGNNTTYEGVAPDVTLMVGIVCDGYSSAVHGCPTSSIVNGMQWCMDNNADIISMSLGGTAWANCSGSMDVMADTVADSSLPVIAVGNSGPGASTVTSPGCSRKALGVGAVNDAGTIASFSGRGPTGDGRIKPDVVAPGLSVISTCPINSFCSKDGTSMATPHVSGAAAIGLEANPSWTPAVLKAAMIATAVKSNGGPDLDNNYGSGLIDVMALINMSHYDFAFSDNVSVIQRGEGFNAYSKWRTAINGFVLVNASNNTNITVNIAVPNNTQSLKVVLYWEENYTVARSQMDLFLIAPNGTVVDSSTTANNTVQMVYNATPVNGTWQVNVSGEEVYNNNTVVFYSLSVYNTSFAYAEYNVSSSLQNFTAVVDGEWINITNSTANDWSLGVHTIKFYSNNTYGNWSMTEEGSFTLLGWAETNESSVPSSVDEDTGFGIACRVRDSNTTGAVQDYNVSFWDNTSFLGSNLTNSTGWANLTTSFSDPGGYNITCNITDDAGKYYNESISLQTAEVAINDTTAPQYSGLANTSAVSGSNWQGNSTWTDHALSQVLFESNYTGNSSNYSSSNSSSEYYFTILSGNLSTGTAVSWKWYANDTTGTWNSTSLQTFVVSAAPSTTPPSGGGGGGGTVAATPSVKTVDLESKFAEESTYQSTFSKKDGARYEFKGRNHTMTVAEVTNTTVILTIASDPYNITLSIGETKNVDLDMDGAEDIGLTLNGITDSKADLTFTKLAQAAETPSEEAPAEENATEPAEKGPETGPEEEILGDVGLGWENGVMIFALALVVIVIIKVMKRPKG